MSMSSTALSKRTYKVVLLGDTSTGKTSIIDRFVNNKFQDKDNPTIGIDFLGKNITHQSNSCRLQLWDTAGQQRYRSLIPTYLKDAIGAIFVFDLSRQQTLKNLQDWLQMFKNNRGQKSVIAFCGNKSDLIQIKNEKMEEEIKKFSQKNGMKYFQVSALSGLNVELMFFSMIDDIVQLQQAKKKKMQEEDCDGPLTVDPMKSGRKSTACESHEEKQEEERIKIKKQEEKKNRFCCLA